MDREGEREIGRKTEEETKKDLKKELVKLLDYEIISIFLKHPAYIKVWFLCLMAYQLFLGYLMSKPFSKKNSSDTI